MKLLEALKNVPGGNTSIPFWSWNNELEDDELLRQLDEMRRAEIYGFIIHARTGLKEEYLGDSWFDKVELCLDYAKKHGMEAWIYDENGWPSGFAGGLLLEEESNRAQHLTCLTADTFDPAAFAAYVAQESGLVRVTEAQGAGTTYRLIYLKTDASNTDILNPQLVAQFIEVTHEQYYRRFKARFGKELAGFFTDEPQYFRWGVPYSRYAAALYRELYGGDIRDGLIHLFTVGAESNAFRIRYYDILNRLFNENFYQKLYEWCDSHGCMLTGHAVEESRLYTQMWGCAGVMGSYAYEHIPGIDWLARRIDCGIAPKQAASVAAQLGKKHVLTETFGCSGWDATPRELKWIAEFQYVNGVNKMCQHLSSYSLKGQGKNDHPPSFSRHNPWYTDGYGDFNRYFNRLGYLLSESVECVDTLVISTIRSVYLTYDRGRDYESVKAVDEAFAGLIKAFEAHGLNYHIGDETIMRGHASVDKGRLIVGNCAYSRVALPYALTLDENTVALLTAFVGGGGKLYVDPLSEVPLCGTAALEELYRDNPYKLFENETAPVMSCLRELGDRKFFYVLNTKREASVTLTVGKPYERLDLNGLTYTDGGRELTLAPMESAILFLREGTFPKRRETRETAVELVDSLRFSGASKNSLTVDFVAYGFDGETYEGPYFIHQANERLIRSEYRGRLFIKYAFTVRDLPKKAGMLFEKLTYRRAFVNDRPLPLTAFVRSEWDVLFLEADIASYLRLGRNEIVFEIEYFQRPVVKYALYDPSVTESLKNCLAIDTEIESVYIQGDFCVDGDNRIAARDADVRPTGLQAHGYRFFNGRIAFETPIVYGGGRAEIELSGRYMTALISTASGSARAVLSERVDVTRLLTPGENTVRIELTSSPRNMLGPHHFCQDVELTGVAPFHFTMYKHWTEPDNPFFDPDYRLVSFGLDSVKLITSADDAAPTNR